MQQNQNKMKSCYYRAKMHIMDALLFGVDDFEVLKEIAMDFIPPVRCPMYVNRATLSLIMSARNEMINQMIVYN